MVRKKTLRETERDDTYNKDKIEKWLDINFEPTFFKLRYLIIIPVICSIIGAILMFYVGTREVIEAVNIVITK